MPECAPKSAALLRAVYLPFREIRERKVGFFWLVAWLIFFLFVCLLFLFVFFRDSIRFFY